MNECQHMGDEKRTSTCILQELETPLRLLHRQHEGGFRRVEAKTTFVVALARKVIVDARGSRDTCVSMFLLRLQV